MSNTNAFFSAQEFYPTPASLARRMVAKIEYAYSDSILEPSAGKGDLVEAIESRNQYWAARVDCIESDENLIATLRGKSYNVVHKDFLAFSGKTSYDTIIMNPPFSKGAEHVMHAWHLLFDGDVIALVNAETLRNPHSQLRKSLAKVVEDHGEVEFLSQEFSGAERRTEVEVALIHLRKRSNVKHTFFEGLKEGGNDYDEPGTSNTGLSVHGRSLENTVLAYEKAIEFSIKAIFAKSEADYYVSLVDGNVKGEETITKRTKSAVNEVVANIKEAAWKYVIGSAEISKYTTDKVSKRLKKDMKVLSKMEFTLSNIRELLMSLVSQQGSIVEECIEEVFDEFTSYYEENRAHVEGWKSNDYFFVGKRVVLPRFVRLERKGYGLSGSRSDLCYDIDRAMAHVLGLRETEVSIVSAVKAAKEEFGCVTGRKITSSYFDIRCFKKGTIHLIFRDPKLLQQFNTIAGRKKGWLPKAADKIPKEFWLMNS